ncbi:acyclic terpene utilization AtuA family protein [Aspergillus stella-maris]|uniref:acyclic terpene utilization AtuA family protein n=1 Tax=Aspergillus stella-maris TaxID=1810926 RepID=UPI003CCD9432
MASEKGKRPVRVANCSGYHGDPAEEMYRQATLGDVDFITGDYLAEVNLANNAQAWRAGKHPGYEETAWDGIQQTIDVIAQKGIKVVINGGALDPKALALKVQDLVHEKGYDLRVAYLSGDDCYPRLGPNMPISKEELQHLDSDNDSAAPASLTYAFLQGSSSGKAVPMVSAHAYLGARGIVHGLRNGADIILCGRVADASPVIAAAWYWHDWKETDHDQLAGSLVAGHLIECSAYVTGGNFSGFDQYDLENFVAPGFPIAEIDADGICVITKHPGTQGMITVDTVRCQFLYELQGSVYLNSDVNAYIGDITVEEVGADRVRVSGIKGSPPPPTTKLAVFYPGGYEAEILLNATGYGTTKKWDLIEKQIRHFIPESALKELETLEFQRIGTPSANPSSQVSSTTYLRIFIASRSPQAVGAVALSLKSISLKHFSGFHSTLDMRTAIARPFLAYYPALIAQSNLNEEINILNPDNTIKALNTGHPPAYAPLQPRESYDPPSPPETLFTGPTLRIKLGDIALARSGDKGGNLNVGFFIPSSLPGSKRSKEKEEQLTSWLRHYLTLERMRTLLGSDWREEYFLERVEFPVIGAVHFVVYGILGRGVSSSSRLDGFGKGVADWLRDVEVDVPVALLG